MNLLAIKERTLPLGILATSLALVATLAANRFESASCWLKTSFGWPCSGCGATRAMNHLLSARPMEALAMNPLITVVAVVISVWALADVALCATGRGLHLRLSRHWIRAAGLAMIPSILANWLYLILVGR